MLSYRIKDEMIDNLKHKLFQLYGWTGSVSVITACTALGMGPASAMSNKAAEFAYGDSQMIVTYFYDQIQLVLPISLVFVVVYYFF